MADIIKVEAQTGESAYKAINARFEAARRWRRERDIGDKVWRRSDELVMGRHWQEGRDLDVVTSDMPRDRITVNVTASTIQDYLPFLVRQKPQWILKPRPKAIEPQEIEIANLRARVASYLLNYHYNEFGMHAAYKAVVDDSLTYGHGIAKSGWVMELNEAVKPQEQGRIEMDDMIRANNPLLLRVDPFKFYFDPTAPDGTLRTARWVSELIYMPMQDIVHNKIFSDRVRRSIAAGRDTVQSVSSYLSEQDPDQEWLKLAADEVKSAELGVLMLHFDKKFGKYYVFALGVEKPLIEDSSAPYKYLDSFFPYSKLDFIRRNGEPYGMGIPYLIEDQQLELNRIRTSEYDHRRKFAKVKFGVNSAAFDGSELTKLTSTDDEVIKVKGPVDQAIRAFNAPSISGDNYRVDAVIQEDIRRMLGLDQLMTGGSLPSRTSAREIDARQSLIGTKLQGRVEAVDEFAIEIGRQVWQHLQANLTDEQITRVAGRFATEVWQARGTADIQGEYEYEIVSSSKEPHDPVQERQQRQQLLEMLLNAGEALAATGHMVNTEAVLKWVLDSYDRPETGAFIQPIPAPAPQPGGEIPGAVPAQQGVPDRTQQLQQEGANVASQVEGAALGG